MRWIYFPLRERMKSGVICMVLNTSGAFFKEGGDNLVCGRAKKFPTFGKQVTFLPISPFCHTPPAFPLILSFFQIPWRGKLWGRGTRSSNTTPVYAPGFMWMRFSVESRFSVHDQHYWTWTILAGVVAIKRRVIKLIKHKETCSIHGSQV